MGDVDHAIFKNGIVHICDRDTDAVAVRELLGIKFLRVNDHVLQHARDTLLKDAVCSHLQIRVDRQVYIAAGCRLDGLILIDLENLPEAVHIDRLLAVTSLKSLLIYLLNAGFPDDGFAVIARIPGLELGQILAGYLTDITDQRRKCFRIVIDPRGILHDLDTGQRVLFLAEGSDGLVGEISCDRDRHVFPVLGREKLIAHVNDVQDFLTGQGKRQTCFRQFLFRIRPVGAHDTETACTAELLDHLVGGTFLFLRQHVGDPGPPVYVRAEAFKRRTFDIEGIIPVLVQHYMEVIAQGIAVGLKNL